ncbi:MAG: adenosylcobinamide-GDP ribazoletransferase [Syntrophorhabdaceae bacterium]
MKRILAAFQFLTIIPIRTQQHLSLAELAGSAVFFPFVGFFQGMILAAATFISLKFLPAGVTSVLIIILYLLTNGGFHLDGLSDTFDALSVKSSGDKEADRERRLAIMRDGTSGPIGITAVVISLIGKYALLQEVLETGSAATFNCVIIMLPMISAWTMTMMMAGARSAREDGLGMIFFSRIKTGHIFSCTLVLFVLASVVYFISGCYYFDAARQFLLFIGFSLFISLFAGYILRRIFETRFGGLTGDNLGAIHESVEILTLLTAFFFL